MFVGNLLDGTSPDILITRWVRLKTAKIDVSTELLTTLA
jgi:hypothetical protein